MPLSIARPFQHCISILSGIVCSSLLLSGCTPPPPPTPTSSATVSTAVTYVLNLHTEDPRRQEELRAASERVIRRLLTIRGIRSPELQWTGNTLTVMLPDAPTGVSLLQTLNRPLHLQVMPEVPVSTADVRIIDRLGFAATALTTDHIDWAETDRSQVTLQLNAAGREVLRGIVQQYPATRLAIFIRNMPVSILDRMPEEGAQDILIPNVLSAEMASVFVDDVTVSRYVTFAMP